MNKLELIMVRLVQPRADKCASTVLSFSQILFVCTFLDSFSIKGYTLLYSALIPLVPVLIIMVLMFLLNSPTHTYHT